VGKKSRPEIYKEGNSEKEEKHGMGVGIGGHLSGNGTESGQESKEADRRSNLTEGKKGTKGEKGGGE